MAKRLSVRTKRESDSLKRSNESGDKLERAVKKANRSSKKGDSHHISASNAFGIGSAGVEIRAIRRKFFALQMKLEIVNC